VRRGAGTGREQEAPAPGADHVVSGCRRGLGGSPGEDPSGDEPRNPEVARGLLSCMSGGSCGKKVAILTQGQADARCRQRRTRRRSGAR